MSDGKGSVGMTFYSGYSKDSQFYMFGFRGFPLEAIECGVTNMMNMTLESRLRLQSCTDFPGSKSD